MRGLALLAAALCMAAAPRPPLRMNDVQVVGSHNSFKARIPDAVMAAIRAKAPQEADALNYDHLPLTAQLDRGVRQLELDIFADPQGGRYADPAGERLAKAAGEATGFDRAAMLAPGFKVFHIPDVDYLSGCVTLRRCLREIDSWSRAHPGHVPIMITINAADRPSGRPGITAPLELTAPLLDALDDEIRATLAPGRIITPDEVRGTATTLRDAVRRRGWPSLDATRGRLYFVLDVRPEVGERYRAGHPSLKDRPIFGWYDSATPEGVVQIVQDPLVDAAKIRAWVQGGLIVRTRSDLPTTDARANDHARADAAAASGAQAVSTDYYPGAPTRPGIAFAVTLPGGMMQRCSPVLRPTGCTLPR
ncbi:MULTISPECIES: Ca2+-dependent phosphoinositide-specific phospholipase C [unclassified Sphingomonas]|uniref:Ca2+-dependent phosphoinositide-specific phospholipase C n=1 Tax=unclassified Sphingomonas TaxID=196159 RepID=UPI000701355C|nr:MULTISPECIES: Ca2+-dependent phosphoinositide-specific phospholipase C [unclassified Sphingomonas]KQM63576.1 hypothetical protein ASE65_17150 [Sphingomonas sp. Leaf16]KQN15192.1 hypothetical protein ASE81_17165 [Sphingomonas sp. Leaf29]KQN20726.1 hypothetical protein ASE83_17130 [Sphingomonas sp. Leaf32]